MAKKNKRRNRRHRRLTKMRIRPGKRVVTHQLRGGRTGSVYFKNRKKAKAATSLPLRPDSYRVSRTP